MTGDEWIKEVQKRVENSLRSLMVENRNQKGVSPAVEVEMTADGCVVRVPGDKPAKKEGGSGKASGSPKE